jgi:2,4-dienoyl-CoA reductase-like NADH-dependent reductase (Old Yellow Enzyme family)
MPHLFSKLRMRDVDFANRIVVSPMCQYWSVDGYANDWHFAHLAARSVGGAALVFTEAAAVTPEGRISPQDLGVWSEKHFEPLERIARFMGNQGAPASNSRMRAEREAPIGLGRDKAPLRKAPADGVRSPRAPSRSATPMPSPTS